MELRHKAEADRLLMSMEEDLVNRFRSSLNTSKAAAAKKPATPTPQEEATTGGASSSTATDRRPWAEPWRPEALPLDELRRPATPRLEEDRRVKIDPRGTYPPLLAKVPLALRRALHRKSASSLKSYPQECQSPLFTLMRWAVLTRAGETCPIVKRFQGR